MPDTSQTGLGFDIEHIVVLMFENRSFDNILGNLYPYQQPIGDYKFEGIPPDASNLDANGNLFKAWTDSPPYTDASIAIIPDPDPGERFQNVNYQLYGSGFAPSTPYSTLGVPPMTGFVTDYLLSEGTEWIKSSCIFHLKWPKLPRGGVGSATGKHIMHFFSPDLTPVFSALAKQYAVCDQWFASVPSQTFPNRMFAHAASSSNSVDDYEILKKHLFDGYPLNNVFQVLDQKLGSGEQHNWRIYYDKGNGSYSISEMLFKYIHENKDHLSDIGNFAEDVKNGLPAYTFIEPNYGHKLRTPGSDPVNSYHPPFNVLDGEEFLWTVYQTLKTQNPDAWQKTLLLVTFDEHGGCYDHFPPPAVPLANATPPFDRYGVRVPSLIISPNVAPGSLFRATSGNGQVLDHTSILRTVFDCFINSQTSINERDLNAPSFAGAMSETGINPGVTSKPNFPSITPLSDQQKQKLANVHNHLSDMYKATQSD